MQADVYSSMPVVARLKYTLPNQEKPTLVSFISLPLVLFFAMSKQFAGQLFVRLKIPYLALPKAAKVNAAKIAKDFSTFIDGVAIGYSQSHPRTCPECVGKGQAANPLCEWCGGAGVIGYSAAEGLQALLDAEVSAKELFEQYRGDAEKARGFINQAWAQDPDFKEGYKWMTPKFAEWFVYNALPNEYRIDASTVFEGRPDLSKVLIEHPKGQQFMVEFVAEFRQFLYGQ